MYRQQLSQDSIHEISLRDGPKKHELQHELNFLCCIQIHELNTRIYINGPTAST
ncbi:hypothetical protein Hanom_Chr01g00070041 [Helianthus anomalus]